MARMKNRLENLCVATGGGGSGASREDHRRGSPPVGRPLIDGRVKSLGADDEERCVK